MNTYELETLIIEEAKKSAVGTRYDWKDLVSFESLNDVIRALKSRRMAKEQCRENLHEYFEDLLLALDGCEF